MVPQCLALRSAAGRPRAVRSETPHPSTIWLGGLQHCEGDLRQVINQGEQFCSCYAVADLRNATKHPDFRCHASADFRNQHPGRDLIPGNTQVAFGSCDISKDKAERFVTIIYGGVGSMERGDRVRLRLVRLWVRHAGLTAGPFVSPATWIPS